MSRIGRLPVAVPSGVEVKIKGSEVRVKGPKGELNRIFSPRVSIKMEDDQVIISRGAEDSESRSLHGTTRALIQNMVTGVSTGFTKILEVNGVGYRMEQDGQNVVINVGYSHPVVVTPPEGVSFEADAKIRQLKVMGFDKQVVGQVAADIRKIRPPEPYKGKGIRYLGERVQRKAGKSAKSV
ncbi:MAG: 50S ribosomal protein L6 [Anaerolineaceae bacterium]|nr:50S ribosomal protein L6 [Anaerolineaceae bacterium]